MVSRSRPRPCDDAPYRFCRETLSPGSRQRAAGDFRSTASGLRAGNEGFVCPLGGKEPRLRSPRSSDTQKDVKLKRIEIRGFKSIAKKTSLPVAEGVTCIAGPNGCGKSNIIDAVRWALGEQSNRSLRAGSMSEVIFSGTQDAPPGAMAEVVLEFARDGGYFPKTLEGFDEVSITRRLHRTGESIYSLNKARCRLKDITDLFLDTGLDRHGYAIVEQGKVKDIIQSRPEDIRYLIEEAAEVGKFRFKRADAMKRLEATAGNLERVRDLLGEVSRQKDDLKAQAARARRYQVLRSEVNDLTRMLWAHEIAKIRQRKDEYDRQMQELGRQAESFRKEHGEYAHAIEAHEARLADLCARMDELKSILQDAGSRELLARSEIEASTKRGQDTSATLEMLGARLGQLSRQADELREKGGRDREHLESLLRDLSALEEELDSRGAGLQEAEEEHAAVDGEYSRKRAELFDAIGHSRATQQRISSLEARRHEALSNKEKRSADLSGLEAGISSLKAELEALEEEYDRTMSQARDIAERSEILAGNVSTLDARAQETARTVSELEKSQVQLLAKISMLDRIIRSAYAPDPEQLPRNNGARRVADALKVRAGFEETVGLSLGKSLDYLIVQDHREILGLDKVQDAGPGYIPLRPRLNGRDRTDEPRGEGVVARLADLVEAGEGYEEIVHALSQGMWVVEDLHSAFSLWEQGTRSCSFVTRDGIILEPSGVVRTTAEMSKYAEGLKAKAEKEELSLQLEAMEQELAEARARLAGLREEIAGLKAQQEELHARDKTVKDRLTALSEKRNTAVREAERLSEREQSYRRDLGMWEEMEGRVEADLQAVLVQKEELEERIQAMQEEIRGLDEKRLAAKQRLESERESIRAHTHRAGELRVSVAQARQRLEGIEEQLQEISRQISSDTRQMGELENTRTAVAEALEAARKRLEALEREAGVTREALDDLVPEHEELSAILEDLCRSRDECRGTLESLEKKSGEVLLKGREQEIALSMSTERFSSRFSGEAVPDVPEGFSPEEARSKAETLEARIERMGQINFASLDAFEHVQARWDDLHRQYEDLVQASERLREVIASIEKQTLKAFSETFEQVRRHFQELFEAMFDGGNADLVLLDGSSPDSGVEIMACPPFKRLKSMSLLSEGEKTLCALSFIFALFRVRPSPFCILDEVDAPLDDANVIRFNRLIRTFARDSQFVIVTHNRHTMEMADILYGVTFDVPGISRVVSMALKEAQ